MQSREATMTKNRNLKARIRSRMARTGESYTTARAHEVGERTNPIPLPISRQRLAKPKAHGAKPGDFPWDRWYARARAAGVDERLAQLGRSVMREADQHAWCRELWERCGWTEQSADGMIRFAREDPDAADQQWDKLMETDGFRGYLSADEYRELSDADFDEEYTAFALAFDPYFPADRTAQEESDPFIEIPGVPGVLAYPSGIACPEASSVAGRAGRRSRAHAHAKEPGAVDRGARRARGSGRADRVVLSATRDPALDPVLVEVEARCLAA